MKSSKEAINFFEYLATNAHHQISTDELVSKQSPELKKIYVSQNSESVRNYFTLTEYLADSIKVTEK